MDLKNKNKIIDFRTRQKSLTEEDEKALEIGRKIIERNKKRRHYAAMTLCAVFICFLFIILFLFIV